ncbi:hypothetical protein [Luteipulveratus halotolerans]|uniref:Uncharacterized protein n=1 Tax=Luteipulveratus halotolerans TaxID=1631356 RepID=A0A0L6CKP0_9MICO|nr:hypothetical protein [Luteipulveratus halotolerans]KNX38073.1 hypothetical protein VV01_14455 [Luteipulveratus halotolerans]
MLPGSDIGTYMRAGLSYKPLPDTAGHLVHGARVTVAEHATSTDDARRLLTMLGLIDAPERQPAPVDVAYVAAPVQLDDEHPDVLAATRLSPLRRQVAALDALGMSTANSARILGVHPRSVSRSRAENRHNGRVAA